MAGAEATVPTSAPAGGGASQGGGTEAPSPVQSPNGTPTSPSGGALAVTLTGSTTPVDDTFDATLKGASADNQFSITIQNNVGAVTQRGRTIHVVVDSQIPWSPLTLYAILGADSQGIMMGWVYCQGNALTSLWLEDTTGAAGFTASDVTGTCSVSNTTAAVNFTTPSETVNVAPAPSYPSIDGGNALSLEPNTTGTVVLDNAAYDLVPFTIVDCAHCGSNPNDGWVEVHSVMSAKSSQNVCLGIFYLPVVPAPTIDLQYVTCFNEAVSGQTFTATYTIPPALEKALRVEPQSGAPFAALHDATSF